MDMWNTGKMFSFMILLLGGASSSDPCDPVFHRVLRRSYDRGVGCEVQTLAENPVCDRRLEPGWYRASTDNSSLKMPTTCLKYVCGTVFPIWLNGTHPSPNDGIVDMTACQQIKSCCDNTYRVKVKSCNGFFVYFLYPTAGCPEGYCFGTGPCLNTGKDSTISSAVTTSRSTIKDGTYYVTTGYPQKSSIPVEKQSFCGLQAVSFLILGLSFTIEIAGFVLFVLAIRKRITFPEKTMPCYCEREHVYEIPEKALKY